MKFLCDEMLSGLGKWLRAAGYDTAIATGQMSDQEVYDLAVKQQRILLTSDSHFLERRNEQITVLFLKDNSIPECAFELNRLYKINWLYRPFSRCLICNTEFLEPPREVLAHAPPGIIGAENALCYCATCKKMYWEGSHTKRMRQQLEAWNQEGNAI